MKNQDIAKIVELVLQNKGKNFQQLFDAIWDTVYYLSYGILGNKEDAEDVSQIVIIKIFKNIEKLKSADAFNRWMNQIVIYTCSTEKAKKGKVEQLIHVEDDRELEAVLQAESEAVLPEEFVDSKEKCEIIFTLIQELPEKQKETILLYYYEELSTIEIADILGCTLTAVQGRLLNARKTLKAKLEHTPHISIITESKNSCSRMEQELFLLP